MFTFSDVTLYLYQHGPQSGSIGGGMSAAWCEQRYRELLANGEGWRIVIQSPTTLLLKCGRKQRYVKFERTS